jgi:hypothetical protein
MASTSESINHVRTRLRAEMPSAEKWAYLDHAAMCPLPRPTAEAVRTWIDQDDC